MCSVISDRAVVFLWAYSSNANTVQRYCAYGFYLNQFALQCFLFIKLSSQAIRYQSAYLFVYWRISIGVKRHSCRTINA